MDGTKPKQIEEKKEKVYKTGKPGTIVTHQDGRRYQIQKDGSWKRLN